MWVNRMRKSLINAVKFIHGTKYPMKGNVIETEKLKNKCIGVFKIQNCSPEGDILSRYL